jgi:hypothetical protein
MPKQQMGHLVASWEAMVGNCLRMEDIQDIHGYLVDHFNWETFFLIFFEPWDLEKHIDTNKPQTLVSRCG